MSRACWRGSSAGADSAGGRLDLDAAHVSLAAPRAPVSHSRGARCRRAAASRHRGRHLRAGGEHRGAPRCRDYPRDPEPGRRKHRARRCRRADGAAAQHGGGAGPVRHPTIAGRDPARMAGTGAPAYPALGITSIVEGGADVDGYRAYQRLHRAGRLRLRAVITLVAPSNATVTATDRFLDTLPVRSTRETSGSRSVLSRSSPTAGS